MLGLSCLADKIQAWVKRSESSGLHLNLAAQKQDNNHETGWYQNEPFVIRVKVEENTRRLDPLPDTLLTYIHQVWWHST